MSLASTMQGAGEEIPPFLHSLQLQAQGFASRACCGLNAEEAMLLKLSLMKLVTSQRVHALTFFGRISVASSPAHDYYVAYALPPSSPPGTAITNSVKDVVVYYSQDASTWSATPPVTETEVSAAAAIRVMFSGDPALEITVPAKQIYNSLAKASDVVLQEAKRIAGFVKSVLFEATVAPRGALIRNAQGKVQCNYSYQGLRPHAALERSSFVKIAKTELRSEQTSRNDFEDSVDVFETLETSQPIGSWTFHRNGFDVYASSLLWPGYHMCASTLNGAHCCVYYGSGRRNNDIGFML